MKIKTEEFEEFASEQGFSCGEEVMELLGLTAEDYSDYKNGKRISRKLLKKMYREFGTSDVINFIEFENYEWEQNLDLFDQI